MVEILLKAALMPVASCDIPAVAPKAIRATTSAYSTRSWPSSRSLSSCSLINSLRYRLFMSRVLCVIWGSACGRVCYINCNSFAKSKILSNQLIFNNLEIYRVLDCIYPYTSYSPSNFAVLIAQRLADIQLLGYN